MTEGDFSQQLVCDLWGQRSFLSSVEIKLCKTFLLFTTPHGHQWTTKISPRKNVKEKSILGVTRYIGSIPPFKPQRLLHSFQKGFE